MLKNVKFCWKMKIWLKIVEKCKIGWKMKNFVKNVKMVKKCKILLKM